MHFIKKNKVSHPDSQREPSSKGQALIEFVLSLPILALIMVAVYTIGTAMYTATNASTAVSNGATKKYDYSDSEQAFTDLVADINGYNMGSFQTPGNNIDAFVLQNEDKVTAVVVAEKTVTIPLVAPLTFTMTKGVTTNLLRNNTDPFLLTIDLPYDEAIPQVAAGIDPSTEFFVTSTVPRFIPMTEACVPDLSVFAGAINNCAGTEGAGCEGGHAVALVTSHVAGGMTPLNACVGGSFITPNDVTFDSSAPNY